MQLKINYNYDLYSLGSELADFCPTKQGKEIISIFYNK